MGAQAPQSCQWRRGWVRPRPGRRAGRTRSGGTALARQAQGWTGPIRCGRARQMALTAGVRWTCYRSWMSAEWSDYRWGCAGAVATNRRGRSAATARRSQRRWQRSRGMRLLQRTDAAESPCPAWLSRRSSRLRAETLAGLTRGTYHRGGGSLCQKWPGGAAGSGEEARGGCAWREWVPAQTMRGYGGGR